MLAILSDLHFCDRTAVEQNVLPAAFDLALREIYDMADKLAQKQGSAVALDLVLLGDVFDLLRTERWFETRDGTPVPVAERPWGSADALEGAAPSPATLAHAGRIVEEIIEVNQGALGALRSVPPELSGKVSVRRLFLTGNHDRLALHAPALHARMREALGAEDESKLAAEGISTHRLELPQYGLLARHGHEWDVWNFQRLKPGALPSAYSPEDYLPAPIGDPITTELGARLPYELRRRLAGSDVLTPQEKGDIYRRMQRIEDVRPIVAALQWAYYEADRVSGALGGEKARVVRIAFDASVKAIVESFRNLDFYRAWKTEHHFFHLDAQKILAEVLGVLSEVTPETLGKLAGPFEKGIELAMRFEGKDRYQRGAALEQLDRIQQTGPRYVVYGHTHEPTYAALHATESTEDAYLNSGTFRRRVYRTEDRKGFVRAENLTYLCFFTRDEARAGWNGAGPAYTAWTGTRTPG